MWLLGRCCFNPGHTGLSWRSPSSQPTLPPSAFPALGTICTQCQGVLQPYLSASSNTTYSTLCSFRFISTATCIRRPGVAMILEGGTQARLTSKAPLPLTPQPLVIGGPQGIVPNYSHVRIFMQGRKLVFHSRQKGRCRLDRTGLCLLPLLSHTKRPAESHFLTLGLQLGKGYG